MDAATLEYAQAQVAAAVAAHREAHTPTAREEAAAEAARWASVVFALAPRPSPLHAPPV